MSVDPVVIRELLHQENDVMNHRMTWFLTLQGFLFAALTFGWEQSQALITVFGLVGIMSCFSVGTLLRHAVLAMKHLQELASELNEPIAGRTHRENTAIVHFILPWHFLPILLSTAWLSLIIVKYIEKS